MMEANGLTCFDVKWESVSYSELLKNASLGLMKFVAKDGPLLIASMFSQFWVIRYLLYAVNAKNAGSVIIEDVAKMFKRAINNARQTGKQLAIALALGYPFST